MAGNTLPTIRRRFAAVTCTWFALMACSLCILSNPARAQSAVADRRRPTANRHAGLDDAIRSAIQNAPKAEQWPDNDYAVLMDLAEITMKPDGTVVSRYRQAYKIFNSRARDLAEVNLPYNESYQTVHVLSAHTIQEDGTILNIRPSDVRRAAQYNEYLLYDDVQGIGFSLPGIKPGCVIDYSWEVVSRPLLMPGQFWFDWTFSSQNPVECSRLTLHYPANKKFNLALRNAAPDAISISTESHGGIVTVTWSSKNLKPLAKEPMMPDWEDISARVEISSLSSWQEIAAWYWNLQKSQTVSTPAMKATVARLTAGKTTAEEKARAIYEWVSQSVRYVGLEFGLSAYKPHAAADVHARLYGDCKDKATLLISMLGEAGITAYPALLQTEARDPLKDKLPALDAFDHCIALADVDGKQVWLDATAETCDYGDIPDMDRGAQALVVRDGHGELKTIPEFTPADTGQDAAIQIDLRPDGSALIKAVLVWRGSERQDMLDLMGSLSDAKKEAVLKRIVSALWPGAILQKAERSEPAGESQPLTVSLECLAPHWARRIDDLLLIPLANKLLTPSVPAFTQEKRVWPIVKTGSMSMESKMVLSLPVNTIVEGMPKDTVSNGPYQKFERTLERSADGRTLAIRQSYHEFPAKIPPEKYGELKSYCSALTAETDTWIVLHCGR